MDCRKTIGGKMHSEDILVLLVIGSTIEGAISSFIAAEKGYSKQVWYLVGFLFPLIGLLGAIGLPDKNLRISKVRD